ncbi:RNA polymerase sigma-70 factor [Mucilaginibacter ginsenosidivorax]|uniref:RNA polymerase sigma-70 factor n=1 Tax=Mucilaginibacter ginsenosidivorax TaxID=862126 RepID=A0A5B8W4P3_9SPHI|nr:RNA polymerase sigma-70 factor [Mucilaginibacter ginsenosidivorax]QEC78519.1 RNA polymerase sigma-70 factor [Mucilaginibacter ginsenosidivorax]
MANTIYKLINETALFAELAKGNESAFETIYHHYNKRLSPFVDKMVRSPELAEEIIQDIFVQLWMNRHLLEEVKHPTSYLFNIATNKTLDYLKKIANNAKLMDKIAYRSTELTNDTEERVIFRESAAIIEMAVSALPEQRKLIYHLSRNEGLTHEQIAERLNISRNTVKNQLVTALKSIRMFTEKRASVFSVAVFVLLTSK